MRSNFYSLAFFVVITTFSTAQRPWITCAWPDVGTTPHLTVVANTLIAFDQTVANSYDHGATWSTRTDIVGQVRGIVDFPSVNGALALTQSAAAAPVLGFFTQSGSNWSQFDSLDIGDRLVTGVATIGIKYFIATNSNIIIVRGTSTSEISVPDMTQSGIGDIAATPEVLVILVGGSGVLKISVDEGQNWTDARPDGGVPPSASVSELVVINGSVYASSDYGVLKLETSNSTLQPVGQWRADIGVPSTTALAGDAQHFITLVTVDQHSQMFRLSISDTVWTESAYPLPGMQPSPTTNGLVVDNGWAVAYHNPLANTPDSIGVYRFDLNDFTDVIEHRVNSGFKIRSQQDGIFIIEPPATPFRVQVFDLLMRSVFECSVEGGVQSISLPSWINGYMCVLVTDVQGHTLRGTVIR